MHGPCKLGIARNKQTGAGGSHMHRAGHGSDIGGGLAGRRDRRGTGEKPAMDRIERKKVRARGRQNWINDRSSRAGWPLQPLCPSSMVVWIVCPWGESLFFVDKQKGTEGAGVLVFVDDDRWRGQSIATNLTTTILWPQRRLKSKQRSSR